MAYLQTPVTILSSPAQQQWWATLNHQWWASTTSTTSTQIIPMMFTSTSTGAATWQNWNDYYSLGWANQPSWKLLNNSYEESREQRELRERQQAEYAATQQREREAARARMQVREHERAAASQLAENLLLACLSAEQADSHLRHGWFDVISSRGRRFRVYTRTAADARYMPGQAGNVALLDAAGRHEARYCVHPPDGLPHADAWLAQKLALEADEDSVMAVANMPYARPGHQDIRKDARQRHLRAVA